VASCGHKEAFLTILAEYGYVQKMSPGTVVKGIARQSVRRLTTCEAC